jgi:hypothetical protein
MTNVASKHGLRAAATERRNKHAQRTPLPPKPGVVEAAKETPREEYDRLTALPLSKQTKAIQARIRVLGNRWENTGEGREAIERYGRMTIPQLKEKARSMGVSPLPARKGELLNAILRVEQSSDKAAGAIRAATSRAKAAQRDEDQPAGPQLTVVPARGQGRTKPSTAEPKTTARRKTAADPIPKITSEPKKAPKKAPSAAVQATGGATVSESKAAAFEAASANLGWATVRATDGDRTSVEAKRGDERIFIEWLGGVFQGDSCVYTLGSRTIKLRNASAAKQQMGKSPESAAAETAKAATVRRPGVPKAERRKAPRALPFTEASLDDDVLTALHGKKITWTSRITGTEESDRVPAPVEGAGPDPATGERLTKKQHHKPRITEGPHGRVLHFLGSAGFRSVLVSQITEVR